MIIVNTDLTTVRGGIIAHGCNAQGVMGSGVAKAIRSVFPGAYQSYARHLGWHKTYGSPIGSVDVYFDPDKQVIVCNLITQEYYGRDGSKYATYTAIVRGFMELDRKFAYGTSEYWSQGISSRELLTPDSNGKITIHIPKIGCSLGGLKWSIMKEILEEIEQQTTFSFVVHVI